MTQISQIYDLVSQDDDIVFQKHNLVSQSISKIIN